MALNIYTSKEEIPEGKEIVFDNEMFFMMHDIEYNDLAKMVIRDIEHGEYLDKFRFYDRFGVGVYTSCFSTGTKTLLNIISYPDIVFNAGEMGDNALGEFTKLEEGAIYLMRIPRNYENTFIGIENKVYVNGRECTRWRDFLNVF